jgi:hypothetical protein
MVRRLTLVLALALAAVAGPRPAYAADKAFEGVVTYTQAGTPETPLTSTVMFKGDRVRTESEMGPGMRSVTIADEKTGRLISLLAGQKLYLVSNAKELAKGHKPAPWPRSSPTGRTETVAGRKCDHYLMQDGQIEMDFCVATGMGYSFGGAGPSFSIGPEARNAFPDGFFPLKIEMVHEKTRHVLMEATHIEAKALPDALFTPPAGYAELKSR